MVFLGERKAILPGAEAVAEPFFFSAQTRREGEWGKPKQRQIWIDFLPLFLIVLAGVKEKTETEKDAAKEMDLRCRIRLHDKP